MVCTELLLQVNNDKFYQINFLFLKYRCGNKAAILKLGNNMERTFDIFNAVSESNSTPHPKTIVPYFL